MKHCYIVLLLLLSSCQLFDKESKPKDIYGCTDPKATNFSPDATIDDASCDYCQEGASFILISKDSGINWSLICLSDSIGQVSDIAVIDSNNFWICTYANLFVPKAQILYTNDGGKSWEEQHSYNNTVLGQVSFEYIEMFDLLNGIALANDSPNIIPIFLKTTDGGDTWVQTTTDPIGISGDIWRRVDFVDINTGYFFESLDDPQKLLKTKDSGLTWVNTSFDGYAYVLKYFDKDIGIAAVGNGIQRTLDGGNAWLNLEGIHTHWAQDIEFDLSDPSKVWLLSDSLYFSSDTGSNWRGCIECNDNGFDAIGYSDSFLWVFNGKRYLLKVDANDCNSYVKIQLPEYPHGDKALGFNFDVVGDVIVIPGVFH